MVVIDEYSRFPETFVTKSTKRESTIDNLDKLFSSYGVPEVIKTDNGPPFKSKGFKTYSKHMGFRHRRITPLHPKANGLVENFNRMIIKVLKIVRIECKPWRKELLTFLLNYRATVHFTTGKSPAELFFSNRPFRTRLGGFKSTTNNDDDVREHDRKQKNKAKISADNKKYVKIQDVKLGDKVLLKITKKNKLTPNYDPLPYTVVGKNGSMVTARRNYPLHSVTRNVSHFKKLKYDTEFDEYSDADFDSDNSLPDTSSENVLPRRSKRLRRMPIRYPENE